MIRGLLLVRERRLELPRRSTHAPQTCLSTSSSTLAYITGLRHPHLRKPYNLSGTSRVHRLLYVFWYGLSRIIFAYRDTSVFILRENWGEQHYKDQHRNNESAGSPFHEEKVVHVQIGVIGKKWSKKSKDRTRSTLRNNKSKAERKYICREKVSVMHPRKQKRNARG